jgi:transcription termination factor Rho
LGSNQDRRQALQQVLGQLRATKTNNEFLRHLAQSLPQS